MRLSTFMLLFISPLLLVGCDQGPKLKGLVPCRGVIRFENAPLAEAMITFSPKTDHPSVRVAVATTNEQGKFELMTLSQKGILPGEYRVSVVKNIQEDTPTNRQQVEQMRTEKVRPERMRQTRKPIQPQKIKSVIPEKYNDEKRSGLEYRIDTKGSCDLILDLKAES